MRALLVAATLALLGPSCGCATIMQAKKAPGNGPAIFGGIRLYSCQIALAAGWRKLPPGVMCCGPPLPLLMVFPDAIFTLVADTAILPVSIVNEVYEGGIRVCDAE